MLKKSTNVSRAKSKKGKIPIVNIAKMVFIVSVAVFFSLLTAYTYNQLSCHFALLKYIYIEGNKVLPTKFLESLAIKQTGKPIGSYNLEKIYFNILSNKLIKTANLAIIYPDTILIIVEEKKPTGIIYLNKKAFILDKNGQLISQYKNYLILPKGLPKISIDNPSFSSNSLLLKSIIKVYEKLDKIGKINYIEVVSDSYQVAHFDNGLNVAVNSFGCPNVAFKRLKSRWSYLLSLKNKLDSVSICFSNKFVLKWKKGVRKWVR